MLIFYNLFHLHVYQKRVNKHDLLYIWQQTLLEHPISDSLPTNNNVIDHIRTSDMQNIIILL